MREIASIIRDFRDPEGNGGDARRTSDTLAPETSFDSDQPGLITESESSFADSTTPFSSSAAACSMAGLTCAYTSHGTRRNPSFATIAHIAAALGISLDVLSALTGIGVGDYLDDGRVSNAAKTLKVIESARANAQATLDAIEVAGYKATQSNKRR